MFARVHNFVPKCYITNIEVDVSTVNKEETFDDRSSLPSRCSIPVVNLRGDVLDSSPFPLHDRASCPSDFEELPVWIFFPYRCSLLNSFFLSFCNFLFIIQVLSEGEQHTLASTPAHPAGLYGKGFSFSGSPQLQHLCYCLHV